MPTILLIEDDPNSRAALTAALSAEGHQVHAAVGGREGITQIREVSLDLVLTDLKLPGADGLQVLEVVQTVSPDVPVIVLSGEGTVEQAVQALKRGARDYLTKPLRLREVLHSVNQALETRRLKLENERLRRQLADVSSGRREIIGASGGLARVLALSEQVAPTRATVLLTGESGTGKEIIASHIHHLSPRRSQPFIKINCAALPEQLLESELFGHERGAFTGADRARAGLFEATHTGTLFLDEIGELSLPLQAKLLRVLQEGEFQRLGSSRTVKVDVRIIAATNQDLVQSIQARTFREDLYYRLNVVSIEMPPLRARREDIPLLARAFLLRAAEDHGRYMDDFTDAALAALSAYAWPGNVRELENAVNRAVVLARGTRIELEDLPPSIVGASSARGMEMMSFPVGTPLAELERVAIQRTLAMTAGKKELAANLLGIGLATLYRRLKELGLPESTPAESGPEAARAPNGGAD